MTPNLPSVEIRALVTSDHFENEVSIFFEEKELETLVAETETTADSLNKAFLDLNSEMQSMFRNLEDLSPDLYKEVKDLAEELNQILQALETKETSEETFQEPQSNYTANTDKETTLKPSKRALLHRKACKVIYVKISKKCHPDKTRRKDLNDLFVQAAKAYAKWDLQELQELHSLAESGRSRKKVLLEKKLREAEERAKLCHHQLQNVLSSNEKQILDIYRREKTVKEDPILGAVGSPHMSLLLFQTNCLKPQILLLKNKIRELDPTRYPQPVQPMRWFNATATTVHFV